MVAEMLGFTTRDKIRLIWGDTDIAPSSDEWFGGRTSTLQGAAMCNAADKLRKDLLQRAAIVLKVDAVNLTIRDGMISPIRRVHTTFAALAASNNGPIRVTGRGVAGGPRGGSNKGVGACFAEVEVDTWTGDWRFIRAVYPHDTGIVINPLVAEADMVGSLVESTQINYRSHPLGSGASRNAALQRRLPVLPAADDHGHSEADAVVHRQSGAALVLRDQELQ